MGPLGGGLLGASSALGPGGTVSSVQVPGLQKSFAFTKSPWGGGKASGGEVGQALLLPPPSDPSRSPPRTPRLATIRRLQCSRPRSSARDHRRRSTAALGLVAADGWRAHATVQPHLGSTFPGECRSPRALPGNRLPGGPGSGLAALPQQYHGVRSNFTLTTAEP